MEAVIPLSVEEYQFFLDDFDAVETIEIDGFPISVGRHVDLGMIGLMHVGGQAALIRSPGKPLRCVADPIPL